MIRDIYDKSLGNVPHIFELAEQGKITTLQLYDNSGIRPVSQITVERGYIAQLAPHVAPWIERTLANTKYAAPELHEAQDRQLSTIDVARQRERRYAPLNQALAPEEAQGFRWLAQTGSIHSYQHTETQRNVHIDSRSGQFYDSKRTPITIDSALNHALPSSHQHSREEGYGRGR